MKGWLDNFGKADNANESNVSMSEDFVGLGYDTKGRNYSPAWGGQFQMGGKLNPISPTQQVQQAVQPTPTVPYLQTKDPSEFYKSWIQSPEYAKRQLLTGYSEGEDLYMPNAAASRESRLGAIEEMTPITYSARQPSEAKPGVYGSPSYVNINPSDYIDTSKEAIQAHELAHIAGAMGEIRPGMMSAKEQEIFKKSMLPMKEPVLSGVQGSKEREASKRALEDWKHSQEPDEAKADLDALRFMMYDKGIYDITKGKKFTETDFEKAKQNLGKDRVFKRLTDRVGKKNFVNLMNTIASADQEEAPIAMGGMSIPGSVGFSYARVSGAAPSKGKYAKKTMASAQNGVIADKIAGLELKMSPEYQYRKYLESQPQLRQAPGRGEELMRKGLGYADVATDVMQLGNFIPHPLAQGIGKVGNVAGTAIDAYQAASDVYKGNYTSAGINAASAVLPSFLGANTFRRNSKYLQPGQPLYSLSPQAKGSLDRVNYIEPFNKVKGMTNTSLIANRALLGGLGAETVYDTSSLMGPVRKEYGGDIPSAQSGIMAPMLLARNVLNYFYPSEEATSTVSAAPVEYKKGLTDELLKRQAYKESTFNPAAVSPAGYKGLTQIGEEVLTDYSKKKGGKKLDPFNPKDAVELQKFAMDDLYNASFINKPDQPDSVRLAKTLAAYNWGRGNLFNYLNEQKQKGVNIYDSYDWLNDLPKETSDYVNKILLQEDQSFNKNYKKDSTNPKYKDITSLYGSKEFGGDVPSAQNGQEMKFYQNGLDWKPKSMQNGGEESLIGKATKFVSEEISDPVTTAALGLLNKIKPLSNTEVYKTVRPVDYPNALKLPMYAYDYVMGNESEPLKTKSGKPHLAEEFWATAMNIPGERQYLKESQYKPSKSKDPNAKYYTIRDVIDDYQLMNLTKDLKPGEKMQMNGLLPILDTKWYSQNANTDKGVDFDEIDPLQRFTLQKSDDGSYVSIYDKYDFNNPALNRMMNTIEIYDRFYLPKKKDGGGIVKDNQGYWNPENWGKPVEIDSNNITMEGVYEPLLGVSDTGDTKLMKPGKNYKFKGKKVTEFPVAKLGINQLDAQPMKKLNQLLNFTNNPDKDNWLDKYN